MPTPRLQDAVIIRFWHSAVAGGADVGHVSVEIPSKNIYVSLWPTKAIQKNIRELTSRVDHSPLKNISYDHDRSIEKRKADTEIILYSLDLQGIFAEYKQKEQSLESWTLIAGIGMAFSLHPNAESCASLAFKLLKAGGISSLTNSGRSSVISSVATPDGLRLYVSNAKKNETAIHPETKHFSMQMLQDAISVSARASESRLIRKNIPKKIINPNQYIIILIQTKLIRRDNSTLITAARLEIIDNETKIDAPADKAGLEKITLYAMDADSLLRQTNGQRSVDITARSTGQYIEILNKYLITGNLFNNLGIKQIPSKNARDYIDELKGLQTLEETRFPELSMSAPKITDKSSHSSDCAPPTHRPKVSPTLFQLPTLNNEHLLLKGTVAFFGAFLISKLSLNTLCILGLTACVITLLVNHEIQRSSTSLKPT